MRGLSPHVRGNPTIDPRADVLQGSIPACAGQPRRGSMQAPRRKVYPRMCGATKKVDHVSRFDVGLSPHVRGNLTTPSAPVTSSRSIPACAGQPHFAHRHHSDPRVYPRMCGATIASCKLLYSLKGLSPHVRGHPQDDPADKRSGGSIPACAGPPASKAQTNSPSMVYPRMCGATGFPL